MHPTDKLVEIVAQIDERQDHIEQEERARRRSERDRPARRLVYVGLAVLAVSLLTAAVSALAATQNPAIGVAHRNFNPLIFLVCLLGAATALVGAARSSMRADIRQDVTDLIAEVEIYRLRHEQALREMLEDVLLYVRRPTAGTFYPPEPDMGPLKPTGGEARSMGELVEMAEWWNLATEVERRRHEPPADGATNN